MDAVMQKATAHMRSAQQSLKGYSPSLQQAARAIWDFGDASQPSGKEYRSEADMTYEEDLESLLEPT